MLFTAQYPAYSRNPNANLFINLLTRIYISMCTLIIDNYDSFTYNLYHLLQSAAPKNERFDVLKNDEITPSTLLKYHRIVASPGPGVPAEAGNLLHIFHTIENKVPYLGICLGHQAFAEAYGAKLYQLSHPIHGGTTKVNINTHSPLFKQMKSETTVARYHSWAVEKENLPHELEMVSATNDGMIMALQHKKYPLFGVQFHPESFMTPNGLQMLQNFYAM